MKFVELFDSRDKKKRLSHIKNLIALGLADGYLDKDETDLIFRIGINAGLTPNDVQRLLERPESIQFYPPDSYRERIEQLYDMVMVMMVDGEFHENEIMLCKLTAKRLGFDHRIIDEMVFQTIKMIADGIATDIAIAKLLSLV